MVGQRTVYEEIVGIAEDYFGPAAPRIMSRLVTNHLHKDPGALRQKDLGAIVKWTSLALSVVTEDKEVIDEFIGRLKALQTK